jgi:hypothetical protein
MIDAKPTPWAGLKYEPVRSLVDKQVARFLRAQRKNMRRFFLERGHLDLYAQLEELRRQPNRNFRQKNESFQRILNEHIARTSPPPASEAAPEAAVGGVVLPDTGPVASGTDASVQPGGDRANAGAGVQEVAGAGGDGIVIDE